MTALSASHNDVNSMGRGAPADGRRGSAEPVGVRIRGFFGGLARAFRGAFVARRRAHEAAETLVSRAYGHLAANTAHDRRLAYEFLAMAAIIYRDSGRAHKADETLTMLRVVKRLALGQSPGIRNVICTQKDDQPR